jgi:hypothetical protein
MDLTMDKSVDPWNMEVKITPSATLIQQFQDWDLTKSSVKKLCSFNRAKQWIALLLNRPIVTPNGHKMRLVDHLAAIDHMARAHRSGISHDDYLRSCLAPTLENAKVDTNNSAKVADEPKIDTNVKIVINDVVGNNSAKVADEPKIDTNVKVVINDVVGKTEESAQVPEGIQSPNEGIKSPNEGIKSPNEGNAHQPICGSIWKGVACETTNCPKAHPSRCEDLNCLILDQGLPRYKILQCKNWHSKPRSKKKKSKKPDIPDSRTSYPRVKKPAPGHVDQWPPLPSRRGPATSKRTRGSSPQATDPVHTVTYHNRTPPWSKPGDPFPKPTSTNHLGNESAAWSTPSLGGSQTTWEAMIRSDPSQKFNLAVELVRIISQL